MKVSELIEALKLMPQDLEVYRGTDVWMSPEKITTPEVVQVEEGNLEYAVVLL